MPLLAVFTPEPGTTPYVLAVVLAGMLANAAFLLLIVSAQDFAPHAVATASGMLMGLTAGVAGVLYVGVGWLQEVIGLGPAMRLSNLAFIPAAVLALAVLARHRAGARAA